MKFEQLIIHIVLEGSVSHNLNVGPSFDFIDYRKIWSKKKKKSYTFFQIK